MTFFQASHALGAALPALATQAAVDPIVVADERVGDVASREALLDRAFGSARFRKTCEALRVGRLPARGLAIVARMSGDSAARERDIVGTVRLWHVSAGGVPALMLGPLAVDASLRDHGIGARLMREAIARARALGHEAILLVGDAPYYARFGFERRHTLKLRMPGPVEDARFLGLELRPGALAEVRGLVRATGAIDLTGRRQARRHVRERSGAIKAGRVA
jgi:predicted N-acetyltransferase YhbS